MVVVVASGAFESTSGRVGLVHVAIFDSGLAFGFVGAQDVPVHALEAGIRDFGVNLAVFDLGGLGADGSLGAEVVSFFALLALVLVEGEPEAAGDVDL